MKLWQQSGLRHNYHFLAKSCSASLSKSFNVNSNAPTSVPPVIGCTITLSLHLHHIGVLWAVEQIIPKLAAASPGFAEFLTSRTI